ncbi:MAG TPA: hypothetical protein VKJ45_24005 [Blastocatellia bacterium]|nr:hypothetical protein [Blastocatellia bacterium]
MNERNNDEGAIRQYLLGQLHEPEQIAIEDRLLTDDPYYQRLEMIEDELIDDYLAGTLSDPDHQAFSTHFLAAPERQNKLKFALAMHRSASAHPAPEMTSKDSAIELDPNPEPARIGDPARRSTSRTYAFASSPYFKIAAALIMVFGPGLLVWRVVFYQSDVDKALALMRQIHSNERLVDSRLSGLDYARRNETRGGENRMSPDLRVKRDVAERILLDAIREDPNPKDYHALGEFYLADRQISAAIPYLEGAVKAASANAQFHSDLGAALLEQGKVEKEQPVPSEFLPESSPGAETLSKSLAELNRALELNPNLLPALFNRALCKEAMGQNSEAREDWRNYIEKDRGSAWSAEAQQHLDSLEKHDSTSRDIEPDVFQPNRQTVSGINRCA